jgi:hypothetical protein
MILPWAHRLISAGAHGLRRIPGQSVNLAHPLFGAHHAHRPLTKVHPRWLSTRGYMCWGGSACSITVPALRYRFGGDDNGGDQNAA